MVGCGQDQRRPEDFPLNDALLRLEYIDPADLSAHPGNWKRHPQAQVDALRDAVARVGWAGALLYNERTGRLIDGHARKELFAGQGPVPVLVGSWPEEQERYILATLDPLGAMAEADAGQLEQLLRDLAAGGDELTPLLEQLAQDNDIPLEDAEPSEPAPPAEFAVFNETLDTAYRCPRCAYEWSGQPK